MKTIKVIDLLNKIANGEEVPKKIKYRNKIFIYDKDNQCYVVENYNEYYDLHMSLSNHKGTDLNYEVEILEEEKKIPEKLGYFDLTKDKNEKDENGNDLELHYTGVADTFDDVYEKINDILDYLDYLKSKGDE